MIQIPVNQPNPFVTPYQIIIKSLSNPIEIPIKKKKTFKSDLIPSNHYEIPIKSLWNPSKNPFNKKKTSTPPYP